jgi:serine/threonine protein kinase
MPSRLVKQRYRLGKSIGQGGFGVVYQATDIQLKRSVAVKAIDQGQLSSNERREAIEAFQQEGHMLAKLMHPHLPRIYEAFADGNFAYLVMDLIDGETLEDQLSRAGSTCLPLDVVLDLSIQLCTVLEYLHIQTPPIIFRDLKPSNVMMTKEGHLYLIDFGIARYFTPGKQKDTRILGSPGYAAPEQYGRAQTTAQADIFSLGAMLHQLFTGDDPTESPFQFKVLDFGPASPLAGIDRLVMNMLQLSVAERPASVAVIKKEMQNAARRFAEQGSAPPVVAPAVLVSKRGTLLCSYRKNGLFVNGAAWSPDGKRIASVGSNPRLEVWDAMQGPTIFSTNCFGGPLNAVAWSPHGTTIIVALEHFILPIDVNSGKQVSYARPLILEEPSIRIHDLSWSPYHSLFSAALSHGGVVVGTEVGGFHRYYRGHESLKQGGYKSYQVFGVSWSPDGKYLVSAGEDKTARVWSEFPLKTIFTYKQHKKSVHAVAWSPNDKWVASGGEDQSIHIWEPMTGKLRGILREHTGTVLSVSWSPDGKCLASAGEDKTVHIWDVEASISTFVYQGHTEKVTKVAWSPDGKYLVSASYDGTTQVWHV